MTARRESRRHSAPLTCRCPKWRLKSPPLRAKRNRRWPRVAGGFRPPLFAPCRRLSLGLFRATSPPCAAAPGAAALLRAPRLVPPRARCAGLGPGAAASCCLARRFCGRAASPALSGPPKAARQPRRGATRRRCLSLGVTCGVLPRASVPCAVPPPRAGTPPSRRPLTAPRQVARRLRLRGASSGGGRGAAQRAASVVLPPPAGAACRCCRACFAVLPASGSPFLPPPSFPRGERGSAEPTAHRCGGDGGYSLSVGRISTASRRPKLPKKARPPQWPRKRF